MTNSTTTDRCLSPPQLGEKWGVNPEKTITLIRSGKLQACNISLGTKRPRFRITVEAVRSFEEGRMVVPKTVTVRRSRRKDSTVIEFL